MHNFTKSTSSIDLQRPHESYSWPFKKLSNKNFALCTGVGAALQPDFSAPPPHFFHAPAAGDTGTPLFKILDPPLQLGVSAGTSWVPTLSYWAPKSSCLPLLSENCSCYRPRKNAFYFSSTLRIMHVRKYTRSMHAQLR